MSKDTSQVTTQGDVIGVAGTSTGPVNITYISQTKSDLEIHSQILIKGSPYLGLYKFNSEDHDKFFGREVQVKKLSKHLEEKNVLLLLGASGSGKSSLIRAGLIHNLINEWGATSVFQLIFVPDKDPFKSLSDRLPREYKELATKILDEKKEFDALVKLVNNLKEERPKLLIFIDQFEELFRLTPKQKQKNFLACLVQLIQQEDNSVKLIMTMRNDALDSLRKYEDFTNEVEEKIRFIRDMNETELRLAISEPAAKNGVTFEKGLVEQIISDFQDPVGSLPLLEYTLDLLWKETSISKEHRILPITTYQDLGRVSGALRQQAKKIYNNFNDQEKEAVKKIFYELIDYQPPRNPASRRTEKDRFEKDPVIKRVLEQLITSRLLVSTRYRSTTSTVETSAVEVAHEELLSSWEILKDLIQEKEKILTLRSRLISDAKQWNELRKTDKEKAKDELWSGKDLEKVRELIKKQVLSSLDYESEQFIQASIEKHEYKEKEKKIDENLNKVSADKPKIDALILRLRAGVDLKKLSPVKADTQTFKVVNALRESVYGVKEYDYLSLASHGDIIALAFSPDAKLIAAGTRYNEVILWKRDGTEPKIIKHGPRDVESVAFSPDGKLLASASRDRTIKLWDIHGKELKKLKDHEGPVEEVTFSADSKLIASASSDNTVKIWSIEGKLQRTIEGHKAEVISVCFSPDGKLIASASRDRTIKLWSIKGKLQRTIEGHQDAVYKVAFSHDGTKIVSASWDRTIKLWSIKGKLQGTIKGHQDAVYKVAFSHDGTKIVSASWDRTIKLWSIKGKLLKTIEGHQSPVEAVVFSPDDKIIASGSKDNTIRLWKVDEISPTILEGHTDDVLSVSFHPDGNLIATASTDNTVKLWDMDGKLLDTLAEHEDEVCHVSFHPDGKLIATASRDKTVKLWDMDGKLLDTLAEHEEEVCHVSFHPDGKLIATASRDKTVKLWDIDGNIVGKSPKTLTEHKDAVYGVSFSPDGKLMATASKDKTVKLWDINGKLQDTLEGHDSPVEAVVFSPDSTLIATTSHDTTVRLWHRKDTYTYTYLTTLSGHTDWVYSVDFSPDSTLIATASSDNTVKFWDQNGTCLTTLSEHSGTVTEVSFSPDGKTVASASRDKTVILWNLDLDDLLVRGCNWVRDYLESNPYVDENLKHLCDGIGT